MTTRNSAFFTRRVLLGASILLAGAGGLRAGEAPEAMPPAPAPAAEPDRAPPPLSQVQILFLGDSLAQGLFLALNPLLRRRDGLRLTNGTQHATGLTRIDDHNWPVVSRELLTRHRPELAIFWIGANDFRPLVDREARARYEFGNAAFVQAYGRRVAAMVENAKAVQARPVWIGLPNMRDAAFAAAAQRLNEIQRSAAEAAGASWISTWEATSDGQGRFGAAPGRDARQLRAEDGVHFSNLGYRQVADIAFDAASTKFPELAEVLGRHPQPSGTG